VVRDLPIPGWRKLALIPLGHYFKPDYLAIIMRKDKVLAPYKRAFIQMLLGGPLSGKSEGGGPQA
jgi:hypothetical protein